MRLFGSKVVLTGVCFNDSELGSAVIETKDGGISYHFPKKIPQNYPGSGDIFAKRFDRRFDERFFTRKKR